MHEQHRGDLAGLPLPQALLQRVQQVLQQAGRLAVVAREGWRRESVASVEAPTGLCGRREKEGRGKEVITHGGAGHDERVEDGEDEVLRWRQGARATPLALRM